MSIQGEEFLVVDEEKDVSSDVLDQLLETVKLFGSSINALNESSVLLRDELERALGATLQRLDQDKAESAEQILKEFQESIRSKDAIRRDYLTRVCRRLVQTESEKHKLEAEFNSLKASQYLTNVNADNTPAHREEIAEMAKIIADLENMTEQLCPDKRQVNEKMNTDDEPTLTSLHNRLKELRTTMRKLVEERQKFPRDQTKSSETPTAGSSYHLLKKSQPDLREKKAKDTTKDKKVRMEGTKNKSVDKDISNQSKDNHDKEVDQLDSLIEQKLIEAMSRVMPRVTANQCFNPFDPSNSMDQQKKNQAEASLWGNYAPRFPPWNRPTNAAVFGPRFPNVYGPRGMWRNRFRPPSGEAKTERGPDSQSKQKMNNGANKPDEKSTGEQSTPAWIPDFIFD